MSPTKRRKQNKSTTNKTFLSVKGKAAILREIEQGKSVHTASRDHGIAQSTIRGYLMDKNKILAAAAESNNTRKTLKLPANPLLEKNLLSWIASQREVTTRISADSVRVKARMIYQELLARDPAAVKKPFEASRGWLRKFIKRNGLETLVRKCMKCRKMTERRFTRQLTEISSKQTLKLRIFCWQINTKSTTFSSNGKMLGSCGWFLRFTERFCFKYSSLNDDNAPAVVPDIENFQVRGQNIFALLTTSLLTLINKKYSQNKNLCLHCLSFQQKLSIY
jgi:Tc5 transposase DNA-binding domain/CENP-B N-terminal DNA-binding domain